MRISASRIPYLAIPLIFACAAFCEEDPDADPTIFDSTIVQIFKNDESLEKLAPESQFNDAKPGGEELWKRAMYRAMHQSTDRGGGIFQQRLAKMVKEEFRSARDFQVEEYLPTADGRTLSIVLSAKEATQTSDRILHLKEMRLIYFPSKKAPRPGVLVKANAANAAIPYGGRIVVSAPTAIINVKTGEGRAPGEAKIEIYAKPEPGKPGALLTEMNSREINWRSWNEASEGSEEIVMYTSPEKPGDPDPPVWGNYFLTQQNGAKTNVKITGRGLIFESGSYERKTTLYDEDGRAIGDTKTLRNRALVHSGIKVDMTASLKGVMPFQDEKQQRTIITAGGPALFDLAALPARKAATRAPAGQGAAREDEEPPPKNEKGEIPLARRFEFYSGVKIIQAPVSAPANAKPDSEMTCRAMCVQYPPDSMPTPTTLPDYAEAIGGVRMRGVSTLQAAGLGAPGPGQAFTVTCDRMYHEGKTQYMYLVGTGKEPAEVKSFSAAAAEGAQPVMDVTAAQFNYRGKTKTLTMPSDGPKRLHTRPDPSVTGKNPAKKADGPAGVPVPDLSGAETIITWTGPMSREVKRLPTKAGTLDIKEVLTLHGDVAIEQPATGMKMRGDHTRVIRNDASLVEYLEAIGGVSVSTSELEAIGHFISMDAAYGENSVLVKNIVTVVGSRRENVKATVFKAGSAIRADKFVIDQMTQSFEGYGGTVAVIKAPPEEKTEEPKKAAGDATSGLFKGIEFKAGGNLFIQCDGNFIKDGKTNLVTLKKRVVIRQPNLQVLADEVHLVLNEAPDAANRQADQLLSGDLKTIECLGSVEVITDTKIVHCDRLFYDRINELTVLEMTDPENDVRIYDGDDFGNTRLVSAIKSLTVDQAKGVFKPGGELLIIPFRGNAPAARNKESSPAYRKKSQ